MAFTIPNIGVAGFNDQAEPDSVDIDILVAGNAATGAVTGCAVTAQGSPDMTVAIAVGTVSVAGTSVAVTAGNVTITTAHSTLPRKDIVVVSNAGAKSVTAGTAATQPLKPAIPANSVVLAEVYVPAADTAINTNQITDKRVFLAAAAATGWTNVVKVSDQTKNSDATLATDTALKFNMLVSTKYRIRGYVHYSTSQTPDIKYSFTGPTAPTLVRVAHGHIKGDLPIAAAAIGLDGIDDAYAISTTVGVAGVHDGGVIWWNAVITNGTTAGDFGFQWAQGTSDAANTTVLAGSYLEYSIV